MDEVKDRRSFLKGAAIVTLAGTAGLMGFDKESWAFNPNAKAVMPDGKLKTRAELMMQLGLNPATAPDAWLSITSCGSNASALTDLQKNQLMKRGLKFKGLELEQIK